MSVKVIRLIIGWLWVLDGLLQLQPKMFTSAFADKVILPMAIGQPMVVSLPIHWVASLFLINPLLFNSLIAIVQLAIGILILFRKTSQSGLLAAIVWGLLVWSLGEAYGGMLAGNFSLLMGSPGAGLIYAIISLSIYAKRDDEVPSFWLTLVWLGVWLLGSMSFVLNFHSLGLVDAMLTGNFSNMPHWLAYINNYFHLLIGSLANHRVAVTNSGMAMKMAKPINSSSSYWFIIVFALIELLVGFGVLLNKNIRKTAVVLGCLILVMFWLVGQRAGDYYTGLMTDLNTAPLLIIIGAVLFKNDYKQSLVKFGQAVKDKII